MIATPEVLPEGLSLSAATSAPRSAAHAERTAAQRHRQPTMPQRRRRRGGGARNWESPPGRQAHSSGGGSGRAATPAGRPADRLAAR